MGKTANGAIWLSKDKLKLQIFGNFGETLQILMFFNF